MAKRKPAAILGDFANYKPILGRKVLALTIEVPIERAAEVFAALGYPTGGDSIPVAVARLEEAASLAQPPQKDLPQGVAGWDETSVEANLKRSEELAAPTAPDDVYEAMLRKRARDQQNVYPAPPAPQEPPAPTRLRHWGEMPPAQQTGVIRNERDFWDFAGVKDVEDARNFIREWCGVATCAEIQPGTDAAGAWVRLQVRYGNWLRTARGAA